MLGDVAAAIEIVAKTVSNTRDIVAAITDARAYLDRRFPDADADIEGLLVEIRKTIIGLARVSDVITEFRFTVTGSSRDMEPARFNGMVIERKQRLEELDDQISTLKGSSGKMHDYAEALAKRNNSVFWNLFTTFGIGGAKAVELESQFNNLYLVDVQIVELFRGLLDAARVALEDVSGALGPPGAALPENVSAAATLLGEYAAEFLSLERSCRTLSRQLEDDINQVPR